MVEDERYPRVLRTPEWDEDEEVDQLAQEARPAKEKNKKNKKVSIVCTSNVCVYTDCSNLYRT